MTYNEVIKIITENYISTKKIEKGGVEYKILDCFPCPSTQSKLGVFKESLRKGQTPEKAITRFMSSTDLEVYMRVKNVSTGDTSEGFFKDIGNIE